MFFPSPRETGGNAPVAQGIEQRPPEPCAQVRILPGAPFPRCQALTSNMLIRAFSVYAWQGAAPQGSDRPLIITGNPLPITERHGTLITGAEREAARRIAFSLVVGNGDAHLKNWSLIYHDHRTPVLPPSMT